MITKLQVKYIQSLGQKKFRDSEAVFVAEGPKIINELLGAAVVSPEMLYATHGWIESNGSVLHKLPAEKLTAVKDQELERISFLQTPNEVLGIFKKPANRQMDFSTGIALMLDGIQDPGNMGTLIRIADWFGVENIICSMDCADAFAPKVVQSTMGSMVRVKLMYTDLIQLVNAAPALQLYAAALNGENMHQLPKLTNAVVVIGNESKGISEALLDKCKHRITIPRLGKAESLNAAVAAGIILSHVLRAGG